MIKKYPVLFFTAASLVFLSFQASTVIASPDIAGGFWANYQNIKDDETEEDTYGTINSEAIILYVDSESKDKQWTFSSEIRFGPGGFTDPSNNSTGDNVVIHKAWIRYNLSETDKVFIGKSAAPFGWKTANFWPGDMFQAGYGDQMDVGIKWTRDAQVDLAVAYFHADDWGGTSTDSTDDNRHWGSKDTFRKVQTLVGDIRYPLTESQTLGFSFQVGKLQDLSEFADEGDAVTGDHQAWVVFYIGQFGNVTTKAEYIGLERDLPDDYAQAVSLDETIENTRAAFEVGYAQDQWFFYLDVTLANADTTGNDANTIKAFAPGFSYNYGPGWIYLEYLDQDGYIDRNGMVNEGDFTALYASIDYYF
ncbi:MAG: hypothetical protein MI867_22385 [Pseudomonadales bacterium]|nr:hypothetical protein [Pseudomonadales bacterium]